MTRKNDSPRNSNEINVRDSNSELLKEFQRQKQKVREQLALYEKQRELMQKELTEIETKSHLITPAVNRERQLRQAYRVWSWERY